jgi:hypothetical protein
MTSEGRVRTSSKRLSELPPVPDRLMSTCDPALVWALMFHGPGCI